MLMVFYLFVIDLKARVKERARDLLGKSQGDFGNSDLSD